MRTLREVEKAVLSLSQVETHRLVEWLEELSRDRHRAMEARAKCGAGERYPMTPEEYLEYEENSRIRHEYLAGDVFAMSGVTKRHNRIALRFYSAFADRMKGGPCEVCVSDVKERFKVDKDLYFYYPDVMVVCGRDPDEDRYVADPKLIIEVLSESTAGVDRHEKRVNYQRIATLDEYAVVAQDCAEITLFRREEDWRPIVFARPEDAVEFRSIGLALRLVHVYGGERL